MRLHSLRLQAFGPFVDEQTIDFDPLGAGGLFLLDGPTGAGKSTVLDAITFALYGPGEGGGWGRLHSHFAAPGAEPRVQLVFSVRGVRQRVTRVPEYRRPKRRGDGMTVEKAQVHLERWAGGRWVSRSSRKDEVGEMLADDLGLTREQFTQVVLLPQGEFMRFLRASDDERRGLLTKLFGTGLYDKITDELDRRRSVAARALDAAAARVTAQLGAVAQAAGLEPDAHEELAATSAADRAQRLAAIGAGLADAAQLAADRAESAAGTAQRWRAEHDRLAHEADVMHRFLELISAEQAHQATRADHLLASAALEAAQRADAVRPLLAAHDDAATALDRARSAVPPDVEPDADPADLRAAATTARARAAGLEHLVAHEQSAAEVAAAARDAGRTVTSLQDRLRQLAERAAALPLELDAATARVREARELQAAASGLRARHEALAAQLDAATALEHSEPRRAAAQLERERAFVVFEQATARHIDAVEQRLVHMAAELAAALRPGRPCSVCGGTEHPAPAVDEWGGSRAADVAVAAKARDTAERAYEQVRAACDQIDRQRAAWAAVATEATVDELRAELAVAARHAASAGDAELELPRLETALAQLEVEADELAVVQREATAELAAAVERHTSAQAVASRLAADLADAADGHPSVASRRAALVAHAEALERAAAGTEQVASARAALTDADGRATAEAHAAGFASAAAARAAVLDRPALAALRAEVESWQVRAAALQAALRADEFRALDPADAPSVEAALAVTRSELSDAELRARAAAADADRAGRRLTEFEDARARLATIAGEHAALAEQAAPVVHLARLARGVAGRRRVTLTTYVLRQWFEQVVAAANIRLSGMSSGRYELIRVDDAGVRTERAGLTVTVLDRHTGEQRSPRSLSGGETFYTSLALALGLADVVRAEAGGVDLDTLFIDEGFGSLDADTLDQVMEVIDELRDRGRTVGIVSHVSELKSRIAERIEVRRLPDGSSTLRVVA